MNDVRLCLVSTPGPICDATYATIAVTPHARIVTVAAGALSATQLHQQCRYDLILLDANLAAGEVYALLAWLADHIPGVHRMVARSTSLECHQALAFGAHTAVRRDELATQFGLLIAKLSQTFVDLPHGNEQTQFA